jgi:hypothetical protein
MTYTTTTRLITNRTAPAYIRRQEIAKAAAVWGASCPTNEEADLAFEISLFTCGVIQPGEFIDEIWQDCPESPVMVRVGTTIIEIGSEGNTLRGLAE